MELILRGKQFGFTLLEVLLAGLILFAVLTSMTLVYRGALLSSGKAERALTMSAALPSIRSLITERLRSDNPTADLSNGGSYGDLDYRWTAKLTHVGRPSVILQEDSGVDLRYFLWDIEVIVRRGDTLRNYRFREISW